MIGHFRVKTGAVTSGTTAAQNTFFNAIQIGDSKWAL
jgi:hypothetical protein